MIQKSKRRNEYRMKERARRWRLRLIIWPRTVQLVGRRGYWQIGLERVWVRYSLTARRNLYLLPGDPFPKDEPSWMKPPRD